METPKLNDSKMLYFDFLLSKYIADDINESFACQTTGDTECLFISEGLAINNVWKLDLG